MDNKTKILYYLIRIIDFKKMNYILLNNIIREGNICIILV